jgi:sirohydrochlorin ferrochelatase
VVAPYLLAPGHFADRTRHATLATGARIVAAPLGPAQELATVILTRYDQALQARDVTATA